MIDQLLVATGNIGKYVEISQALGGLPIELLSLQRVGIAEEPEESGYSYTANARLKALYFFDRTGIPTIADDSGLEVEALGGGPGPLSARFAGAGATDNDRMQKLLKALEDLEDPRRKAQFVCVIALAHRGGEIHEFTGRCSGRILREPRGLGGFGYDPIFVPDSEARTFAEMAVQEKRSLSHRGRAIEQLRRYLEDQLGLEKRVISSNP